MALVIRGNKAYFYKSVRVGGRVRCHYFGSGQDARDMAEIEVLDREVRDLDAQRRRARRQRLDARDRAQARRFNRVELLIRLVLESAGFHRHKRGQWRRRRMGDQTKNPAGVPAADPPLPASPEELGSILGRALQGDESVVPRLRELIRADPERMLRICQGDLAWFVEETAIQRMVGKKNLLFAEGMRVKLELLRAELAGPDASPVERLLAERAALCYLDVHDWELRHNGAAMEARDGLLWDQHAQYQKMRDRAHRRYLQALKALAHVRKLGPAIQVNLARNQVNVAGPLPNGTG
jgi:hypothetical protein